MSWCATGYSSGRRCKLPLNNFQLIKQAASVNWHQEVVNEFVNYKYID